MPASPSLASPTDTKAAMANPEFADYFAVAYLQLCVVSYDSPDTICQQVADPKVVQPWGNGSWAVTWGPAQDALGGNLAFVATYTDTATKLPVAAVLVTRGTDISGDAWGDLEQAFEDFMIFRQLPLPWLPNSPALVAEGSLDALAVIEGLQSKGVGLRDYLAGFLGNPANQNPVLVLTGHSLGGCITTVAAPWLKTCLAQAQVKAPIVPVTFAAPTAGNAAFASYFQQQFPYAPRYVNSLDIAPFAWGNLDGIRPLYEACNFSLPWEVSGMLDVFEGAMRLAGVSYGQPGQVALLKGACGSNISSWYAEAALQHHATTYLALMTGRASTLEVQLRPRTPRSAEARAALEASTGG